MLACGGSSGWLTSSSCDEEPPIRKDRKPSNTHWLKPCNTYQQTGQLHHAARELTFLSLHPHPDRVAAHARLASYLTGASEVVAIFVHTARALTITKRCDAGTSIMQHYKSAASRVICALTASPNKECLRAAWTATNHGYTYPQCHRLPPLPR